MDEKMMREKVVQVLERGKESVTQMKRLIDHHHHHQDLHDDHDDDGGCFKPLRGQLDVYSLRVLTSFATALSMIHNFASFDNHDDHQGLKRPINPTPDHHHHHHVKSEEFEDWEAPKTPNGRGSYKRRKTAQVEMEAPNIDDGYAWRKYGQKVVQHTKHPRCTHKTEQGCQATKQVQQISDNPPKYKIIYHGHHTCKNPLKTPALYFDLIDKQDDSSILLSFETPNNPKHGLNHFMLPSSSLSSSTTTSPTPSATPTSNAMVEQEYKPFKDEIPSEPSDHHCEAHAECPSSSDFLSTTSDLTNTTFVSDDVISLAEVYSSAVSPHGVLQEDYSYMMDEFIDFSQVFQDNYLLCA